MKTLLAGSKPSTLLSGAGSLLKTMMTKLKWLIGLEETSTNSTPILTWEFSDDFNIGLFTSYIVNEDGVRKEGVILRIKDEEKTVNVCFPDTEELDITEAYDKLVNFLYFINGETDA